MKSYFVDEFVNVQAGDPIRLFPFQKIFKGGKVREITQELVNKFRLPHFKPAIKLGSHMDETPAGGHITGLQVRDDGLYANVEWNDKGAQAVKDGAYRYHSPEVIWEGGYEDPKTGEEIPGPMVVGLALLHTPHLGEDTAFYHAENIQMEGESMSEKVDTVEVPLKWYERVFDLFGALVTKEPEEPQTEFEAEPTDEQLEEFAVMTAERDDYKSQLEAMQAEKERAELFGAIREGFQAEEFGSVFQEYGKDDEVIEQLAGMTEEQREWVVGRFGALSAQIDGNLEEEKGSGGDGQLDDPQAVLLSAIQTKMEADGLTYLEAFEAVRNEQPELLG